MTSELSDALNPNVSQTRSRKRLYSYDASYGSATPTMQAAEPSQRPSYNHVPHRSELELAIIPPEPQTPARTAPAPPPAGSPTFYAMQNILRAIKAANQTTEAERKRRLAWEQEQEARYSQREAELESQVAEMRAELSFWKASMSQPPPPLPSHPLLNDVAPETYEPPLPEPSAHIEEIISPTLAERHVSPPLVPPVSHLVQPHVPQPRYPTFVEGSSTSSTNITLPSPLLYPDDFPEPNDNILPSPALTNATTDPSAFSAVSSPVPRHLQPSHATHSPEYSPTHTRTSQPPITVVTTWEAPSPALPSPAHSAVSPTPRQRTPRSLGKRRVPPSPPSGDDSEYSDGAESPPPAPDAPRKRKNGHDQRCFTIQHAIRDHILRLMRLRHNEALPESHNEAEDVYDDQAVRFVWEKTVKKCPHNAAMKERVLKSLISRRNRYKLVPDKDFERKVLDSAFEQAFLTFRQKYKMQKDEASAEHRRRREDQKYMKVRRKERKKTKLTQRTDRRQKLDVFSHTTFDPALRAECMSSEESCDEYVESAYPSGVQAKVQVLRVRGLPWRSSRLLRFYATLDAEESAEQMQRMSNKPRRPLARKERCLGPPKAGFVMPPQGVASWMISRHWVRENQDAHPDLEQLLKELVLDPPGFDWSSFDALGDESESDMPEATERYIPRSDTSYSLAHALAPVS